MTRLDMLQIARRVAARHGGYAIDRYYRLIRRYGLV